MVKKREPKFGTCANDSLNTRKMNFPQKTLPGAVGARKSSSTAEALLLLLITFTQSLAKQTQLAKANKACKEAQVRSDRVSVKEAESQTSQPGSCVHNIFCYNNIILKIFSCHMTPRCFAP